MTPTRRQEASIRWIALAALERAGADGEFKQWAVSALGTWARPSVFVTVETGQAWDERDMRSVFCRTRGSFVVGPNGGILSTEARHGKPGRRGKARKYPLIYGFTTFGE